MSLNDKRFGVEIECYIPLRTGSPRQPTNESAYRDFATLLKESGLQAAHSTAYSPNFHQKTLDMSSWLVAYDSSVSGSHPGYVGVEITSPPLKGRVGLDQLKKVCKLLKKVKALSDHKCGLHVHHEIDKNSFKTEKLGALFFRHQEVLFNIIKRERRESDFCKPLPSTLAERTMAKCLLLERATDRRYALNFEPVKRGTVEFRLHHGTVRFVDIYNWVLLTQKFVETSQSFTRGSNTLNVMKDHLESTGPAEIEELQRTLSNSGIERTVAELDSVSRRYACITRVERGDGKVVLMIAQHKTPADELIEALNITEVELKTMILGKFLMRAYGDVDDRIVRVS